MTSDITLREHIALMAMQGLLGKYNLRTPEDQITLCRLSVELADTLINELLKNEDNKSNTMAVDINRQKDFYTEDEIYCNWYKCPSCESYHVRSDDNFCSNCGCKFEWSGYHG